MGRLGSQPKRMGAVDGRPFQHVERRTENQPFPIVVDVEIVGEEEVGLLAAFLSGFGAR
jgi:hypothetical protein